MSVTYSIIQTQYGKTLIAMEDNTLAAFLFLVENETKMMKLFHSKFPNATECKNKDFTHIAQYILNSKPVKFKMTGTSFQQTVWTELLKLGGTASYQEIANRIKKPKAVRAVASAVAQNLLHVIIPCHLVVKSNGDIGKYAGGTALKKLLITKLPLSKSF